MCITGNNLPFFSLLSLFLVKTHGSGGRAEGRGSIRAQSQDVCRSGQCFCISRSCSSCPSLSLFRFFLSTVSSFGLPSVCIVSTSVLRCVATSPSRFCATCQFICLRIMIICILSCGTRYLVCIRVMSWLGSV